MYFNTQQNQYNERTTLERIKYGVQVQGNLLVSEGAIK